MIRSFVGIYDPAGRGRERRDELARSLDVHGNVCVYADGPLTLAYTGPVSLAEGRCWCLLDGSVYNLDEVARDAGLAPGPPEAVLAVAHRRHGDALIRRLRGDFALILWDSERCTGVVARDQTGGRGVYHHARQGLLFGSDARELLAVMRFTPGSDPNSVTRWLASSDIPPDRTLFTGIARLEHAHLIELREGVPTARRYWSPRAQAPLQASRADIVEELRLQIARAVALRVDADGTTGILLSGGLDSSSIAGTASRLDHGLAGAYSGVFPDHPATDESSLIGAVAGRNSLTSTRIVVSEPSVLSGAVDFIDAWRVPPLTPNLCWLLPLARRAARDGVTSILDGEDGDKLFGASPYYLADLVRHARVLAAVRLIWQQWPRRTDDVTARAVLKVLTHYGLKGALPPQVGRMRRRLQGTRTPLPEWLTDEGALRWHKLERAVSESDASPRWWREKTEQLLTGALAAAPQDATRRIMAMTGIQARHPFADVDLIELLLRIPPSLALDPALSRPLLRASMEGLVPDDVRLRADKSIFNPVAEDALAGSDRPLVRRLLDDPAARVGGHVDLRVVRRTLLDREPPRESGPRYEWGRDLFNLVMLECWLRAQEDSGFLDRLRDEGANGSRVPHFEVVAPRAQADESPVSHTPGRRWDG